jgi:hypothetical protein
MGSIGKFSTNYGRIAKPLIGLTNKDKFKMKQESKVDI